MGKASQVSYIENDIRIAKEDRDVNLLHDISFLKSEI